MKRIGLLWNRNNIERPGSAGAGSVSIKVTNYQRHPLSYRELAESNIFKGLENNVVVGGVDAVISEDRYVSISQVTGDHIEVVIIVDITNGDIEGTAGSSENGRLKPKIPLAWPSKMEILFELKLVTAISRRPSPLKSAVDESMGKAPTW